MQLHNNKHNYKVSPTVAIATTSAILFSAVAVGVMAGVIPGSISKSARAPVPVPPPATASVATPSAPAVPVQPNAVAVKKQEPAARVAANAPARPGICPICGSVVSIDVIQHESEGAGLRTVATVVGISGGAYADHEIEKHANSTNTFNVAVRMDDGTRRNFDYDAMPGYRAGDKVKVVGDRLVSR